MHNSTSHSQPNKGINYTDLSMSLHPNTTTINRKQSSIPRQRYDRKISSLQISQAKNFMGIIENANNQLQQYLFNLNQHIKKVIQKREADYFAAFENHVGYVERQLKQIKQTYQESKMYQKTISLQQVIIRLEKQCEIFRREVLRYFELLEQKQQELKNTQRQSNNLKRQLQISEFTKKKLIQQLKQQKFNEKDIESIQKSAFQQFVLNYRHYSVKLKAKQNGELCSQRQKLNEKKFRKTLLDFDLKNSDTFFKNYQKTERKATTRSFLYYSAKQNQRQKNLSFCMKSKKCTSNQSGNQDSNDNKTKISKQGFDSSNYQINVHKRFLSEKKLDGFQVLRIEDTCVKDTQKKQYRQKVKTQHSQQKISTKIIEKQNQHLSELRQSLRMIITERLQQTKKNKYLFFVNKEENASEQSVMNNAQEDQKLLFNFNSDHSIGQFVEFIFPKIIRNQQDENEHQKIFINKKGQQLIGNSNNYCQDFANVYPFQLISSDSQRLKEKNNVLCSTIYSIQKGQKNYRNAVQKYPFMTTSQKNNPFLINCNNNKKIIAITKKKSTLKNKKFAAQWTDLKINKTKAAIEKQKDKNIFNVSL